MKFNLKKTCNRPLCLSLRTFEVLVGETTLFARVRNHFWKQEPLRYCKIATVSFVDFDCFLLANKIEVWYGMETSLLAQWQDSMNSVFLRVWEPLVVCSSMRFKWIVLCWRKRSPNECIQRDQHDSCKNTWREEELEQGLWWIPKRHRAILLCRAGTKETTKNFRLS